MLQKALSTSADGSFVADRSSPNQIKDQAHREEKMRIRQKLVTGYIPYTLAAMLLVLLFVLASHSWAAQLAGGVIFVGWSFGLLLCQLAILCLPGGSDGDKSQFHIGCVLVTGANLFVSPLVVALLIWLASQVIRAST